MNKWDLKEIVKVFDSYIKGVDFKNLPPRESEFYRQLLFKAANDGVFCDGRDSFRTEYMLEIFDLEEVNDRVHDPFENKTLSYSRRKRLNFYLDVKDLCYPLFKGQSVNWSEWPWQLKSDDRTIANQSLYDFITKGEYPNLSAAILYDLKEQLWKEDKFYSSVARNRAERAYTTEFRYSWGSSNTTPGKLLNNIKDFAEELWFMENHNRVGQLLGFDFVAQAIYDAFDTFISKVYRYNQVQFAFELASWMHENLVFQDPHPAQEKVTEFDNVMRELMQKHDVSTPDISYTWNILTLEVWGLSPFPDRDDQYIEDEEWGEGEY